MLDARTACSPAQLPARNGLQRIGGVEHCLHTTDYFALNQGPCPTVGLLIVIFPFQFVQKLESQGKTEESRTPPSYLHLDLVYKKEG